jgi:hypothetical protein
LKPKQVDGAAAVQGKHSHFLAFDDISQLTGNSFLVNGADVEEGRNNGTSVIPTLDSIQEFRLLT